MTSPTPAVRWRRRGLTSVALLAVLGGAVVAPTALAAPDPEVPTGSLITGDTAWHYLDDGTDPSPAPAALRDWTLPAFDDSAWKTAPGSFGAKNGKLGAVGPQTPKTLLNHYLDGVKAPTVPTYFFRTTFELEAGVAEQVAALQSTVTYDDALIVWINGTEVARYVDGRITDTTNVEYAGDSNGDPLTSTFSAEGALLHDGTNTIAVSLFQDRATSSDIFFDMSSLTLVPASDPGTPVIAPPTRVILTPTERPEVSQSFSWLAGDASHTVGQVEIGAAAGGETRVVDAYDAGVVNGNPNKHFSATVTGLTPATEYRYRVGLPGSWSDWFTFRTADPNATDFQFLYYGDAQIGLDTTWPSVVKQAEANALQCSKNARYCCATGESPFARSARAPIELIEGLLCGYSKAAFHAVSSLSPAYSWLPGAAITLVRTAESSMPLNQLSHSFSLLDVLIRSPACTEPIERGAFASACFTTLGHVVSRPIWASP